MSEWEMEKPAGEQEAAAEQPDSIAPAEAAPTLEQLGLVDSPEAGESETARIKAVLEAVVYVTDEPLSTAQIAQGLSLPLERVQALLDELSADYAQTHRGLSVREVAGGYKMGTKPEVHDDIRAFVKKLRPPLKLSLPALETLAVIAYKQPVTAPEIMEIRGVQGAGVLKTLLERKLIAASGRKQVVGKPVLYRTTKDFLVQFGLKDLTELPTLKEFEEWSRLAVADAEVEAGAEASAEAPATTEALSEAVIETSPEALPEAPTEASPEAPTEALPDAPMEAAPAPPEPASEAPPSEPPATDAPEPEE